MRRTTGLLAGGTLSTPRDWPGAEAAAARARGCSGLGWAGPGPAGTASGSAPPHTGGLGGGGQLPGTAGMDAIFLQSFPSEKPSVFLSRPPREELLCLPSSVSGGGDGGVVPRWPWGPVSWPGGWYQRRGAAAPGPVLAQPRRRGAVCPGDGDCPAAPPLTAATGCSGFYRRERSIFCPFLGLSQPQAGCWGTRPHGPPRTISPLPVGALALRCRPAPSRWVTGAWDADQPPDRSPQRPLALLPRPGGQRGPLPSREHAKWLGRGTDTPHPAVSSRELRAPPLCSPRSSPARLPGAPVLGAPARRGVTFAFDAKSFPHPMRTPRPGRREGAAGSLAPSHLFPPTSPPPFLPAGPFGEGERLGIHLA